MCVSVILFGIIINIFSEQPSNVQYTCGRYTYFNYFGGCSRLRRFFFFDNFLEYLRLDLLSVSAATIRGNALKSHLRGHICFSVKDRSAIFSRLGFKFTVFFNFLGDSWVNLALMLARKIQLRFISFIFSLFSLQGYFDVKDSFEYQSRIFLVYCQKFFFKLHIFSFRLYEVFIRALFFNLPEYNFFDYGFRTSKGSSGFFSFYLILISLPSFIFSAIDSFY